MAFFGGKVVSPLDAEIHRIDSELEQINSDGNKAIFAITCVRKLENKMYNFMLEGKNEQAYKIDNKIYSLLNSAVKYITKFSAEVTFVSRELMQHYNFRLFSADEIKLLKDVKTRILTLSGDISPRSSMMKLGPNTAHSKFVEEINEILAEEESAEQGEIVAYKKFRSIQGKLDRFYSSQKNLRGIFG